MVFDPSGAEPYTLTLLFLDGSKAAYLAAGDKVATPSSGVFTVVGWQGWPADFCDGGLVSVSGANPPMADSYYNSACRTDGQASYSPALRTQGVLLDAALLSGAGYEYSALVVVDDSAEADKAEAGDSVVDASGKEYRLTHVGPGRFDGRVRVREELAEGVPPAYGACTLFRRTAAAGLYQGSFVDGWQEAARQALARVDEALASAAAPGEPPATGVSRDVAYGMIGDVLLLDVPANASVTSVDVMVLEEWDGAGAAMSIGTPADHSITMFASDIDLASAGTYAVDAGLDGPCEVRAYFSAGVGATSGLVRIQVETVRKG